MSTGATRLRAKWSLFLSLFLFLPLLAAPYAAADVGAVQETFEDDALGANPSASWYSYTESVGGTGGAIGVSDLYALDGTQSLEVRHGVGVGNSYADFTLGTASAPSFVEFAVRAPDCSGTYVDADQDAAIFYLFDGVSAAIVVGVSHDNCSLYYVDGPGNPTHGSDLTSGWNIFRLDFDYVSSEFDIRVNGILEVADVSALVSFSSFSKVRTYFDNAAQSSVGSAYFDNIGLDVDAGATVPVETHAEPFDGQTPGDDPWQPWYTFTATGKSGGADVNVAGFTPHAGDRMMRMEHYGISNNAVGANFALTEPTAIMEASWAARMGGCGGGFDIGTQGIGLLVGDSGIIGGVGIDALGCAVRVFDGDDYVDTGDVLDDDWHEYRMTMDFDAGTYDVFLDGVLIYDDAEMPGQGQTEVQVLAYTYKNPDGTTFAFDVDSIELEYAVEGDEPEGPEAPGWVYVSVVSGQGSEQPRDGFLLYERSPDEDTNTTYEAEIINSLGTTTIEDDGVGDDDGALHGAFPWSVSQEPTVEGSTAFRIRAVDPVDGAGPWSCVVTKTTYVGARDCGSTTTFSPPGAAAGVRFEVTQVRTEESSTFHYRAVITPAPGDVNCIFNYHLKRSYGGISNAPGETFYRGPGECDGLVREGTMNTGNVDTTSLVISSQSSYPTGLGGFGELSCAVVVNPYVLGDAKQCGATATITNTGTSGGGGIGGDGGGGSILPDASVIGEQLGVDAGKIGWFLGLLLTIGLAAGLFFLPTMAGSEQGSPVMGVLGVVLGIGTSTVFGYFPVWFIAFLVLISMGVFVLMRRGS